MALYFLDTSVLVKLYIAEAGSDQLIRALALPGNRWAYSTLARVEFRAAARARQRRGDLTLAQADAALADFDRHARAAAIRQVLSEAVFEMASVLIDRHPLRALDALQLASHVVLGHSRRDLVPVFTCADRALLAAARAEHIPCWNPASPEPPG